MLILMVKLTLDIYGTPLELTLHAKIFRHFSARISIIDSSATVYFCDTEIFLLGFPGLLKNDATAEISRAKVTLSKIKYP